METNQADSPNLNKQEYLETLKAYLNRELDQVRSHAEWYNKRAKQEKARFYYIRIPMIVASFVLSLLVSLEMAVQGLSALTIGSVSLSLTIGLLGSIDILLGYGKSWVEKREAELAMYSLLRRYKREKIKIDSPRTLDESIETASKIIDALQEEYERVVSDTVEGFVNRSRESETLRPSTIHTN